MRRFDKPGSCQQHYVRAREIMGEVLCLWAPTSPTRRAYRVVLEVSSVNFVLKSAEEQEALLERYRNFLKTLTFSLQIIIRNEPLDLRPYLTRIHTHVPSPQERPAEGPGWYDLAMDVDRLLSMVGSRRTLTERHCYIVVPAPDLVGSARGWRKKRRRARQEEMRARALQELAIRVEMVRAALAGLGLRTRTLFGEDLARFYHRCFSPSRAFARPLQHVHLVSVGHLPQVLSHSIPEKQPTVQQLVSSAGVSSFSPSVEMRPFSADEQPTTKRSAFPAGVSPFYPSVEMCPFSAQDLVSLQRLQQDTSAQARPARKQQQHASDQSKSQSDALPPPDLLRLADLLAPAAIEEERDVLTIDGDLVRGIAVTAFPREVSSSGWLAPLLLHDEVLDIVMHLHPQDQGLMLRQLKRRRSAYATLRGFNRRTGRSEDPETEVAHHDVTRLMSQLASGGEGILETSLFLLVRAPNRALLDERSERVMALLQTVFLDAVAHPTTFEHAQAFRSFLPEGRDELRRTITLDTSSLATTFPFISNALQMPGGTFLGITGNGEPVFLDPWDASLENPHTFVGGVTGGGKSYFGKLWVERSILESGMLAEQTSIIDPDGEYERLARALRGAVVHLAAGSNHHLNPFDLRPPGTDFAAYLAQVNKGDRLAEKVTDLLSFLDILLADHGTKLTMRERSLLDHALYETYRRVGISADPRTHYHQPPLLRDLYEVLKGNVCGKDEFDLTLRLSRYVEGSLASLFAEQTNVPLDAHLLVWNIFEMRGDLCPIGIFLIADFLWTQAVSSPFVRRALYIDEAASLLAYPEGGVFLSDLSRRARKRYMRLVVMTQSPERFVEDAHGAVVASNAAMKVLKKQDRTSLKAVASRFDLTPLEARRLNSFGVNEALVLVGDRRVLLTIGAGVAEHEICTTHPVELAAMAEWNASREGGATNDMIGKAAGQFVQVPGGEHL
jgi:hypothetical protein